jgi:putative nucleotidyltransferase with HDIG domain
MYGLKRKITALSEAVVFVGQDEIKKIALGMTIFEKMFKPGASGKFNRILFWRHCISVAVLSMEIAGRTGYPEPEGAYIAGLLHDIGKIILDTGGKTDYEDFLLHLSGTADLLIEKERSIIGLGHDDVGAFFCTLWKLPRELALAVKYHHQPFDHLNISPEHKQLISIVSLADFLCWAQGIGSFDLPCPPVLPPEVELKKKKEELARQEEQMRQQILVEIGSLVIAAITKNDLGQADFDPQKKEEILQIAAGLKDVI